MVKKKILLVFLKGQKTVFTTPLTRNTLSTNISTNIPNVRLPLAEILPRHTETSSAPKLTEQLYFPWNVLKDIKRVLKQQPTCHTTHPWTQNKENNQREKGQHKTEIPMEPGDSRHQGGVGKVSHKGSIPKTEEPGKNSAPFVKVPGSWQDKQQERRDYLRHQKGPSKLVRCSHPCRRSS